MIQTYLCIPTKFSNVALTCFLVFGDQIEFCAKLFNTLTSSIVRTALGAMIFGSRLGCVSLEDSYADRIHEFVHCIQQLFVESSKMTMIPAKLAFNLKLPVWRRFEKAAERALSLGNCS